MPHLARITIYPLKSFDGQDVESARVLPSGALEHDRRFALVDHEGQWVNSKRTARVHPLRTAIDVEHRTLEVEHAGEVATFALDEDREEAEQWFSLRLHERVRIVENATHGFPDDNEAPGPTIVSTATLETVASWFPGLTLDNVRRRFRANVEIGGVEAFWEDRLYAAPDSPVHFRIGDVALLGVNPCARCVVPSRDPATGEIFPSFAKLFSDRRAATLPTWAQRERFDHFYRLTVNTRLAPESDGGTLRVENAVAIE